MPCPTTVTLPDETTTSMTLRELRANLGEGDTVTAFAAGVGPVEIEILTTNRFDNLTGYSEDDDQHYTVRLEDVVHANLDHDERPVPPPPDPIADKFDRLTLEIRDLEQKLSPIDPYDPVCEDLRQVLGRLRRARGRYHAVDRPSHPQPAEAI